MKQGWQKVTEAHLLVLEPSAFIRDRDTVEKLLLDQDNGDGKNISAWNSSDLLWVVRLAGYAGSWHLGVGGYFPVVIMSVALK